MSEPTGPSQLPFAIQAQREKTITALCDHFSSDRLTVEEFERRLDVANRALTLPELASLLVDLPAAQTAVAPAPAAAPPLAHARDQQTLVAVMGGVERRGRWQPAKKTLVVTMMGGAALDFREVNLPAGETEVTVICVMGGAEIIVPPGMQVDAGGIAIMGGFEHMHHTPTAGNPDAPLLRINGFVMMGGVEVQVRLPGETPKDVRHRLREEQRRLRNERRRR
jgi:hypothetical protein